MSCPDITVVIPTRHRNELLALCLDRLAPGMQSIPFECYEVIVTDDGVSTNARSMIQDRFPWVLWVQGARCGPAANRNRGARAASAPWIAFTDDDCLPEDNWLEMLVRRTGRSEAGAIEGAILPVGHPSTDLSECPVNLEGGRFWAANIAVRRDLFQSVGGFDESYPMAAHEDQDLFIRLLECTQVQFEREAVVLHPVRDIELRSYLRLLPARARAYAIHLAKHRPSCALHTLLFESVMFHLKVMGRYARQRKLRLLLVAAIGAAVMVPVSLYQYRRRLGQRS